MYRKRARASRFHQHSSVDARFRYITRTSEELKALVRFRLRALAFYATQGLSNKVISAMMFSASKLARSGKGPIALRPHYLALILILVAPGPSRSQEAAASGLKGTVHSALTEDFGDENCGSDKPLGSLYEIYDAQGYVIRHLSKGSGRGLQPRATLSRHCLASRS